MSNWSYSGAWELCASHVLDSTLAARLKRYTSKHPCPFCGNTDSEKFDGNKLAEVILDALQAFHEDAGNILPFSSRDGGYQGTHYDVYEVIEEVLQDEIFDDGVHLSKEDIDVVKLLAAPAGGWEQVWTPTEYGNPRLEFEDLRSSWSEFREHVKHKSRFFLATETADNSPNSAAGAFLREVKEFVNGHLNLMQEVETGTVVHRGRLTNDPRSIKPNELGVVPREYATANRLSPAGVPLFYGALEMETAIAEIAGDATKQYAVIGSFKVARALKVLDFTQLPEVTSIFAEDFSLQSYVYTRFLKLFVKEITSPIPVNKRPELEYVPTQVLTEYFQMTIPGLDGLKLPSAQNRTGVNLVIFENHEEVVTLASDEENSLKSPILTLNPVDVGAYEVIRNYSSAPVLYKPYAKEKE